MICYIAKITKKIKSHIYKYSLIYILGLSFLVRIPSYFCLNRLEYDEAIYKKLINKFDFSLASYSLQNENILKYFPAYIYNKPLFHHPPLYVTVSKISTYLVKRNAPVMVSIISDISIILLVWKSCIKIFEKHYDNKKIAIIAALTISLDPVHVFNSSKIWSDSLFSFLLVGAIYFSIVQRKQITYFIFLALAVLTKTTGFFILPIFFTLEIIYSKKIIKNYLPVIGALLVNIIWIIIYHKYTGVYFLDVRATDEFMKNFPFVENVVHKPFYFYPIQLILLNPVYILSFVFIGKFIFVKKNSYPEKIKYLIVLILFYFIFFTFIGIIGGSYQMRYFMPAIPFLAVLASLEYNKLEKLLISRIVFYIVIGIMMIGAITNTYLVNYSEPMPIIGMIK